MTRELNVRGLVIASLLVFAGHAVAPAFAQSGGDFDLTWNTFNGGGGNSSGGLFALAGTAGQASATELVGGDFRLQGGYWQADGEAPCTDSFDCGDQDDNGIRDDPCLHYQCIAGTCVETPRGVGQTDMGGQFGACANDGTCDGNDFNLALNCFGNSWIGDPCEVSPPQAINVDGGSQFGSCILDGVCDGNDANAALNCFGADGACPCGAGPTPEYEEPEIAVVGQTGVTLRASANRARPGDLITVDVYFDDAVEDIKSYQLHIVPTGGESGQLELVDIAVEKRRDLAFDVQWQAFNVSNAQLVVGMDPPGVAAKAGAYLATYTYHVSRNASGTFAIDLLHDNSDPAQRTFLFPTPNLSKIEVTGVTGAKIVVDPVLRVSR